MRPVQTFSIVTVIAARTVAETVFRDTADYDEYTRIKELSTGEFAQEALTGKWEGVLGYEGSYSAGGDGGLSISGSGGGP